MRSAVERQFEVFAEALNAAKRDEPDVAEWIPQLREIVGLRNKIAHGYDTVDDQIVWDTVMQDIPGPLVRMESLLASAPSATPSSSGNIVGNANDDNRHD